MLVSDLLLVMDEDQITMLVLLDLSTAFNTIDHKALFTCLQDFSEVNEAALQWVHYFLRDLTG